MSNEAERAHQAWLAAERRIEALESALAPRCEVQSETVPDGVRERGRHYDIIAEALEAYDDWMKDDDYNSTTALNKIMKRMRERLEMSDPPQPAPVAQASGQWQPVEQVPPRSNAAMLLYFPSKVVGAYKQSTLPAMYRTGHPNEYPNRPPSHFMPIEAPAVPSADGGPAA